MAMFLLGPRAGSGSVDGPLLAYTVNYPLSYFARRIAGVHAAVEFPAPGDEDPAFWVPSIEAILEYQKADLILLNGAGYARWLSRASLPFSKLVNTSAAFGDRYMAVIGGQSHSHGPAGQHSHTGTAFTTWLDFGQAAMQARAVAQSFIHMRPELKDTFERGLADLERDLLALDSDLRDVVDRRPGMPLLASHPIYQYAARRYGLNIESVQWEPGEAPTPEQWTELREILNTHPARWMVWESEPLAETARRLTEIGVATVVFDPGANVPATGDWLDLMRDNIENLRQAFE